MSTGRLEWVDLARGVTIVLVVLYHVAVGAGHALLPAEHSEAGARWAAASRFLQPLRMPLFFLLAGMFAHSAARREWSKVWRSRIADLWWPYLLWSAVFAVTAWPRYSPEDPVGYMASQGMATLTGAGPYWFILMLPLYFLLVRAGRDHPRALLGIVALLYIGAGPLRALILDATWLPALPASGAYRFAYYAIWYVTGWALRKHIFRYTDRAPAMMIAVGAAGFVGMSVLLPSWEGYPLVSRLMVLAAGILGLSSVFPLLRRLALWPPAAILGAVVGSRTLPIYLIHPLFINVVVMALPASWLGRHLQGTAVADVMLVPVITVLGTAAGVLFALLIDRVGPYWALAAPRLDPLPPRIADRAGRGSR
ncbi:acyltransferase family protein [Brachybacterium vulturis]|uniref:acyltransferase family protein n=1 Tax=Brachybacterium vulturis TaxID=2017484 RepID=UPI00373702F5